MSDGSGPVDILLVEDDGETRVLTEGLLEDEGYRVRSFGDPTLALQWLEQAAAPAVVLLDWMMPGLSGEQLCAQLRSRPRWSHLPLVVVSASRSGGRAMLEDANVSWVPKPVDLELLLATVARLVRRGTAP